MGSISYIKWNREFELQMVNVLDNFKLFEVSWEILLLEKIENTNKIILARQLSGNTNVFKNSWK